MFFPKQESRYQQQQQPEFHQTFADDSSPPHDDGFGQSTTHRSDLHHHAADPSALYAQTSGGSDTQVDFGSQETPHTVDSLFSGASSELQRLKQSTPALPPALQNQELDYIFYDERKMKGERGWSEKMCYNTGTLYAIGLATGGIWGLYEGLRQPINSQSSKLRLNTVLNACTRRGPLVGNSAGVATIFFTSIDHGLCSLRGGEDDMLNRIGAAGLAGVLFKSTAGWKAAGRAGLVFSGAAALLSGAYEYLKPEY